MKRSLYILLALLFSAAVCSAEIVWNKEKLSQWKSLRNVKTQFVNNTLILTDIKKDSQINGPAVNIDPKKYNHISITYRAAGTPRSGGEFYFHNSTKGSIARQMWHIPSLRADGKWHTMVLTEKNIRVPELWFNKGPVTRFRLDITNAAGGKIEIREIRIFYKKAKSAAPKARPAARRINSPEIMDEGKWAPVKPEFSSVRMPKRNDPYFQGKMIKSPFDTRKPDTPGRYYLRREFMLKEKPVRAWLQFNADDRAWAYVNGTHVETNAHWRVPSFTEMSKELEAGKNVLAFAYENKRSAGGVMAELYVEYKNGSFERINTDEKFTTSVKADKNWNNINGKCAHWQKVIALPGAPNPPWGVRLEYRDFSKPQHLLGKKLFNKTLTAGDKVHFRFDFKGKPPALPFHVDVILTDKDDILYQETIALTSREVKKTASNSWKIEAKYPLPLYMSSRKVLMTLRSGALFCKSGGVPELEFNVKQVKTLPRYAAAPRAQVLKRNGIPQLFINGKQQFMLWGGVSYKYRPDKQARHSSAPLNVVTVYCGNWWKSMDKISTVQLDNAAENYRRNAKDAWFIWDLSIYPPPEFTEKYPLEMAIDDKGKINKDGRLCFSFASKIALAKMRWALAQAISYLEKSPYANRIIGYRINSGHTVEWLGWDPAPNRILDFSPAAQKGFKAFAAKHYPQLKDTRVPSLAERRALDNKELLWDQKKHLKVIAYHDYYSNAVVDMMLVLLRDARRLAGKNKIIGTYYGYVMTLHGSGRSQMRAHYATKRLLDSKAVDFLMSPQAYSVRQIGDIAADMKPFRSMQNNNIIPAIEDDTRTHIGPYLTYSNNHQTHTEKQTIAVMRRNMGTALCRLLPGFTYALTNNGLAYDFPAMAKELANVRAVGEHTYPKARRNAEIAYVVSEETIKSMPMFQRVPVALGTVKQRFMPDGSVRAFKEGVTALCGTSFQKNYTRLARLGAPADYILAEDLKDNPGNYKLYIFINTYKYDAKFLAAVKKLQQRKCTLIWFYAPGYTFGLNNSTANMKRLTGLDFVKSSKPLTPMVKLAADNRTIGCYSNRLAPTFALKPAKGVTVWGKYEDGSIGLGARKIGNSLNVFCGPDLLDIKFISDLARKAGVHIYSSNSDPMEANSDLLMLHARFAGKKVIDLPVRTNVLDVHNKRIVGRNVKRFVFNAPLHSTHLFYLGKDADQLLKKLK